MKNGRVVLAVQAELSDDMEDMMKRACWVDITKSMGMSERVEYEYEAHGQAHLFDPSNPEALNFLDEQSMKSLSTQVRWHNIHGRILDLPRQHDLHAVEQGH
jgi:hypothetical protein